MQCFLFFSFFFLAILWIPSGPIWSIYPYSSGLFHWHCGNGKIAPVPVKYIEGPLQWRHNEHDGVSYHQPHDCLLNCLFRRRSKKTSKLCITGLCEGNSPVNSPHKRPVMRKMFPFDDVIMTWVKPNSTIAQQKTTKHYVHTARDVLEIVSTLLRANNFMSFCCFLVLSAPIIRCSNIMWDFIKKDNDNQAQEINRLTIKSVI